MENLKWSNPNTMESKNFICGYCNQLVASEKGWFGNLLIGRLVHVARVYICPHCKKPTFFGINDEQTPGIIFGKDITDISDEGVQKLYDEARRSVGQNAYTATVLCCRKLLMHVAVSKGAKKDLKFIEYVEYLSDKNFITPDAKEWVDYIRSRGNEANHEIIIMTKDDAENLLSFSEMLLQLIYEFPAKSKKLQPHP